MLEITDCILCLGAVGDDQLERTEVWRDDLWRLTTSISGELLGFSYLEPQRHIESIADLDGDEAQTFGPVIARVCAALRDITGAERVYIYVFGDGIPHLHVHLAPHWTDDPLNDQIMKGELIVERLDNGAERVSSKEYLPLPEHDHHEVIELLRDRLAAKP